MYTWVPIKSPNDLIDEVTGCLLLFSFNLPVRPSTIRWEYNACQLVQLVYDEESKVPTLRVTGTGQSIMMPLGSNDDKSELISILQRFSTEIDALLFQK
jgi:hypothetical protein